MGDLPGTAAAPEAFQTSTPASLDHIHNYVPITPPPSTDPPLDLQRSKTQRQQKRSSLPARPNGAARHAKRLTLNFPINIPPEPPVSSSPGAVMTPVSRSSAAHTQSPVPLASTPVAFEDQDDGSGILTAIASQERRVLELKEELQRAETELDSLKKQWAVAEKSKKRTAISHRAEQLVPLRSPDHVPSEESSTQHSRERSLAGSDTSAPSPAQQNQNRYSQELQRRQSMRAAASKGSSISSNGRRVFQGSHARTLSLLSPAPGDKSSGSSDAPSPAQDSERVGRPPRSATLPSSVERTQPQTQAPLNQQQAEDMISQWRKTMPPPSREVLMRTGKQMATDLREGLWTFLEDIRQATVGEEGINATESRTMQRNSSSSASRSRDRLSVQQQGSGGKSRSPSSSSRRKGSKEVSGKDSKSVARESSFWSEFGIDTLDQTLPNASPPPVESNTRQQTEPNEPDHHQPADDTSSLLDVEENWDDWDTPQPKKTHTPSSSRSTFASKHDESPMTQNSSPRTSTSFGEWRHSQDSSKPSNSNSNSIPMSMPDPSVSDGIPWPAITKLAPSKLTRTASNLMAEWERSLSPSPSPEKKERDQRGSPVLDKDDKKD